MSRSVVFILLVKLPRCVSHLGCMLQNRRDSSQKPGTLKAHKSQRCQSPNQDEASPTDEPSPVSPSGPTQVYEMDNCCVFVPCVRLMS
jgi:hypothetical protein